MLDFKRRRWLAVTAFVVPALLLVRFALIEAGVWLVVEDPLEPARAVVVLGGKASFRAMEAAKLYNQGWAHEVWLTRTNLFSEDSGLAQPGIDRTPEHVYSRMVLERLGVPGTAIRVLSGTNYITADEVRTVARELTRYGGDRVILVTSSYHTRRVKILWHALVGKYPEAVVRYTPDDLGRRSAGDVWASVRRRDSVSEGEGYLARRREGRHPHQR